MEILSDLLQNLFFWVFIVGLLGGYVALRAANRFRDQAAFADFPDRPEKYLLRARVSYGLFVIFLLAVIIGLGIVVFQVLQVVRPQAASPTETPISTLEPTSLPPSPTPTRTSVTATPLPTPLPSATALPTEGPLTPAVIGNTNFQGVNCRETAGVTGKILVKLVNGTEILVVNGMTVDADGYTWQQVQLEDGRLGWIVVEFLATATPSAAP